MQPAENIKQHVHHTNPQNQMSTLYSPGGTLSKDEQATITRDEDATIRREFIPHSASTTGTLLKLSRIIIRTYNSTLHHCHRKIQALLICRQIPLTVAKETRQDRGGHRSSTIQSATRRKRHMFGTTHRKHILS